MLEDQYCNRNFKVLSYETKAHMELRILYSGLDMLCQALIVCVLTQVKGPLHLGHIHIYNVHVLLAGIMTKSGLCLPFALLHGCNINSCECIHGLPLPFEVKEPQNMVPPTNFLMPFGISES